MSASTFQRSALFGCEGLVAVVTGGGSGLGATMARALAANGASVVYILGRRLNALESVAASFAPGKVVPVVCDVSSKDSLAAAAEHIRSEVGYINLLIANAGIMGPGDSALAPTPQHGEKSVDGELTLEKVQETLWKTSMSDFVNTFQVNVAGVHFTAVAFLDLLDKGNKKQNVKQTSQIIVTTSVGSFHRSFYFSGMAYNTSKAAVTHEIKSLAAYLIKYKIRVNGIAPGIFESEINVKLFADRDVTQEGSFPVEIQPMTRAGKPEEFAGTLLYLASEAGGYCTGSIQLLDGGRVGGIPGATY